MAKSPVTAELLHPQRGPSLRMWPSALWIQARRTVRTGRPHVRDSFTTFLSRVAAVGSGWRESVGVPEDSGPRKPSSLRPTRAAACSTLHCRMSVFRLGRYVGQMVQHRPAEGCPLTSLDIPPRQAHHLLGQPFHCWQSSPATCAEPHPSPGRPPSLASLA